MSKKIDYCVTRVPSSDWDNIMETVTLDGSYSEEIKNEIWTAIKNMEDFSKPWIVIKIRDGNATVKIFRDEKSARKYLETARRELPDQQVFCAKGQYQS